MRRLAILFGAILIFGGGAMVASSIIMQPPARGSLPVVNGTVVGMWRYVRRSGTDMRVQIAPQDGDPRTFWIPIDQLSPGALNGIRGLPGAVRHASTGEVMELVVDGRTVINYAVAANKRAHALVNNRWIGFGIFMAGATLASVGLVFRR